MKPPRVEMCQRQLFNQHDLDEVLQERDKINGLLRENIADSTVTWGVIVERFEMKDVELPEAMHKQVIARRKAYRDLIIQVLKRGMAEGEFGDIDVDFAARAVIGLCDWANQWYRPTGPLGTRAVAERAWKLLRSWQLADGSFRP